LQGKFCLCYRSLIVSLQMKSRCRLAIVARPLHLLPIPVSIPSSPPSITGEHPCGHA
jgi:hypothetical protein